MSTKKSIKEELKKVPIGSHLCLLYNNKDEQLTSASHFIKTGLTKNEKCVYVTDERTKEDVINAFEDLEIDVKEAIKSGQLVLLTSDDSYLKNGFFDIDEMIEFLEKEEKKAMEEGYSGLRGAGEMSWFFTGILNTQRLLEYEKRLETYLNDSKTVVLCQYNENKFDSQTLINLLQIHPKVIIEGSLIQNPYFISPELFKPDDEDKIWEEHYKNIKENMLQS